MKNKGFFISVIILVLGTLIINTGCDISSKKAQEAADKEKAEEQGEGSFGESKAIEEEDKKALITITEVMKKAEEFQKEDQTLKGIKYLQEFIEKNPVEPAVLIELLGFYTRNNEYDKAEKYINKMLKSGAMKDNDWPLVILGGLYVHQNKFDLAQSTFEKAIKLGKEYGKANMLFEIGKIYFPQNTRIDLAKKKMQQAIKLQPKNSEFKAMLEQIKKVVE